MILRQVVEKSTNVIIDIGIILLRQMRKISYSVFFRGRERYIQEDLKIASPVKWAMPPSVVMSGLEGFAQKPKIKCSECPHRAFLPVR